jgi:RimJ/RimL family protein N-acetyltransferase
VALPDPPLVDRDAGVVLRPWAPTPGDVAALVAAWTDPVLAAANGVPDDVSAAAAARWIRGDADRRAAGTCLDLVIGRAGGDDDTVLGEAGLRNIDRQRRRAEISWWVGAEHRGQGLAVTAAGLLVGWALSAPGGLDQVWARIDPANTSSGRVAAAVGLAPLGPAGGTVVWARTTAAPAPPSPVPSRQIATRFGTR